MRSLFASALLCVAFLYSSALAADDPTQFTGHWTLKAEQSEINPASQWVTEEMDVALVGHLLEFTEKQSFGADEDVIRRQDTHLMFPNGNLSKGDVRTIGSWNHGALVETSSFPIGKHKQRALVRLELGDHNILIRNWKAEVGLLSSIREKCFGRSFYERLWKRFVFPKGIEYKRERSRKRRTSPVGRIFHTIRVRDAGV